MDSFLLATPRPSPSIVTSAPLLQPHVNKPWLNDSDTPTFIPSNSSPSVSSSNNKRRHDVSLPPTPSTFFLATPLELIRHGASPPPTPPRFHLHMRPSGADDILDHQMTAPSTPSPVATTNWAPQANQAPTPTTKPMAATELLSVGPNSPDLAITAITKDLSDKTSSMTQPKIVAVATKKRKMMRRNASFNALCA